MTCFICSVKITRQIDLVQFDKFFKWNCNVKITRQIDLVHWRIFQVELKCKNISSNWLSAIWQIFQVKLKCENISSKWLVILFWYFLRLCTPNRSHWNTNFRSWNEWNYCINRILESQEIQMNSAEARLWKESFFNEKFFLKIFLKTFLRRQIW